MTAPNRPTRLCTRCRRRKPPRAFAGMVTVCRSCSPRPGELLARHVVDLAPGRSLRVSRYGDGDGERVAISVVRVDGAAASVVASFSAELLPAVRAALERV